MIGLIVFLYIPILFSLTKLELKTKYKPILALIEVLLVLIIAIFFWIIMYMFHQKTLSFGVVIAQILALVLSLIVNGIILMIYNMAFLNPKRANKEEVLILVIIVMFLVHLILSFSFGWKTAHNDEEYRVSTSQEVLKGDT
jgi:ABC-type transport system involved in cytochrome c biogenesis permease subunit